ncbi:cysteine synthase A [Sediminispirochaeta smaragdinae]|uniref:cysteine synthase n=1 Tax=Sediminispirochaeta smaragdinae (strain DSM 11293 / JCM 15392 / SEBR 4228) TaxID=573413 RepID=E1R3T2_SEDSS|nr:cysteine synthase A [Sediminispirochaeta smaragdinae]ADK82053.1 cysteine synthase A [Sediminispirochaeta smaragdinae DSM 11293]
MKIAKNMTELIGNTPLVYADVLLSPQAAAQGTRIAVKLESANPLGCVKERIALAMIEQAEADGSLRPGGIIVEPTSGNTGVGLAGVAAVKGYHIILTMPESMSMERRKLLAALGAELVLTPAAKGMKGAIEEAEKIASSRENAFIPGQFDNPANPEAHRRTTAQEIWRDTDGKVDLFVAGVGTGGTVTGTGSALKAKNPKISVVAVEPEGSPVLSGGSAGPHKIQGIGAGFVPSVVDMSVIDRIITISDEEAGKSARLLAKKAGLLVGISSGAAAAAAARLADEKEHAGKLIVALLPDTGERYLSTWLFEG